ncbi:glycosyltransferase family 117 protein [Ekhidna sp.]
MKITLSNSKKVYLIISIILQVVALVLMKLDTSPHGFSSLSLTIAPILLFIGLVLPVFIFSDVSMKSVKSCIYSEPLLSFGFGLSVLVPLVTYILTIEPTASIWDCSETIATAYKLQVPHTPGIPLTLLIGRLFSLLALGNVERVAFYINLMSAVFSALSIGITFLITMHFGCRILNNKFVVLIGSLGGVLCLTFSDSFWFSAVEAETYGPSMFFMTLLIWLSIKANEGNKITKHLRLLQFAYILGLSYCIHPMCILILPVCALIWRDKKHSFNWKYVIVSCSIGIGAILIISKVVAVDLFEWAFRIDLLMVNIFSLPFYSGVIFLLLFLAGLFIILWFKFEKARLSILTFLMILFGFSPYLMLFVRSSKMPPINEFTPSNLAKIKPYMNRESYPSRPLIYGPYFDAEIEDTSTKAKSYVINEDRYEEIGTIPEYHYTEDRLTILPRIYSNDPAHIATYRQWTGLAKGEKPGFIENVQFMIKYQLGEMYFRYLLWNFSGRVSDEMHAGWLKPWQGLPDRYAESYSRATNQYFMIPLIIGFFGLFYHYKKDKKGFVANLSFFLITGLLLAVYLNATPNEPRERDYIYVGSFVSFSVWIGIGIMSMTQLISPKNSKYLALIVSLIIPLWMFHQNLDDHDRSSRTFQLANARNLLDSCEKNAVLFTGGDNDTFPLWYLQDVEGFRTDVRVKVMSYFNADWYINQLTRRYYDSPPLALTLKKAYNEYGPYNPLYIYEKTDSPILWDRYMEALKRESQQLILPGTNESKFFYLPSKKVIIPTSKGELKVTINGRTLPKSELAILDLIYSNDWQRPIYFNFTGLNSLQSDLRPYLIQEGLVYRLKPSVNSSDEIPMDIEKSQLNLVDKADYSNLNNESVYFNHEDYEARMIMPTKFAFNNLIRACLEKGEMDRAKMLVLFAFDHLYHDHLQASYADIQLGSAMKILDMDDEAQALVNGTFSYFVDRIKRQLALSNDYSQNDLLVLQEATRFLANPQRVSEYESILERIKNSL